tara:strand:- start:51 stop:956 length:906 start_codon:yes stop_codon:yes gene_type:complete
MINDSVSNILQKYNLIKNNYTKLLLINITNFKTINEIENIYYKGCNLLTNVFNISLLYSDNLLEVYNLCEKSYIYYIEFVNQINLNISNDSSFELTLKDAVIFSYKKTIFNLDNTILNKNDNTIKLKLKLKLKIIEIFINIINKLYFINDFKIFNIFHSHDINQYKLSDTYNEFTNLLDNLLKKILSDTNKIFKKIINNSELNTIFENTDNYDTNILYYSRIDTILFILYNFCNKNIEKSSNNLLSNINNLLVFFDKIITKKLYIYNINYNSVIDENFLNSIINNENITQIIKSFISNNSH